MWSLTAVRSYYTSGLGTPRDLVAMLLKNISLDSESNAWIHLATLKYLETYFLTLGDKVDASKPLWGIPFAVKDNIDVSGMPTTAGCPDFAYTPSQHALAVQRLIDAGAIPLGKTNMDQFATGLVGTRSPYGAVPNPYDHSFIAGGSSSGSAAALALNQCSFALGTDTAGSGRVPAAFCGLVGYKPTYDYIPTQGLEPACASLDCISVFAHDASEAQCIADIAANQTLPTLLLPKSENLSFQGHGNYASTWANFTGDCERTFGISTQFTDIALLLEAAKLLYEGPWIAERWNAVGAFIEANPEALHAITNTVLQKGKTVSGSEVFAGLAKLKTIKEKLQDILPKGSVLAMPTTPGIFTLQEVEQQPLECNTILGTYTNFLNLLGLCALTLPAGQDANGMPFGITLIANSNEDGALHSMANRLNTEWTMVAVCGAHMRHLPLNHELLACAGVFIAEVNTSAEYALCRLLNVPAKPGMWRIGENGCSIQMEIWRMPKRYFGGFVSRIPFPLGIGNIRCEDGSMVQGFLCDCITAQSSENISNYGGWRNYLASQANVKQ